MVCFWGGSKKTITADVVQFNSVSDSVLYQQYIHSRQFEELLGETKEMPSSTFEKAIECNFIISHRSNGYIILEKGSSYLIPQPDGSIQSGSCVGRGSENNNLFAFTNEPGEMIYAFDEEIFVGNRNSSQLSVPVEIGQEVKYTRNGTKFSGKIMGLGLKSALIKSDGGNATVLYEQLLGK